uniref:Uncharacterized protein n=1 Tax=Anopheles culicifacies TaxID=139723 RepID=A0A182MRE2_9DIPT
MVRLSSIQNCIQPDVGNPACFFGTDMLTLSVESSNEVVQVALHPVWVWVEPAAGTTVANNGPVASDDGTTEAPVLVVAPVVAAVGIVEPATDSAPFPSVGFRCSATATLPLGIWCYVCRHANGGILSGSNDCFEKGKIILVIRCTSGRAVERYVLVGGAFALRKRLIIVVTFTIINCSH